MALLSLSTSCSGSTASSTAPPTTDPSGTPASATSTADAFTATPLPSAAEWQTRMAPILALTKVAAGKGDALQEEEEEEEELDCGKLEQRRAARHVAAAAMAAAAAPTRPQGGNQWSEVDALTEGVSLLRVDDTPDPFHFSDFLSSQAYIADALAAAEKIWRLDVFDHGLHVALHVLRLDDEVGSDDAKRAREAVHASTQDRLVQALEMESNDTLPKKVVPTSAKVDGAFSGLLNLLTLEKPETTPEEEANFLNRVTAQTSVGAAISALATDKVNLEEDEKRKASAPAREEKMLAMELNHREAVWRAHAEAQVAREERAKREEEEEEKAAAAREGQRVAMEAEKKMKAIRDCLAGAKRRRTVRIRRKCLAPVREAREDRRSLFFPCSWHLRSSWRQGKLG